MSYTPRLTAPDPTDLRYINYRYGGYNRAIAINTSTGLTMPNCVGYCHGRAMEILNIYEDPGLSADSAYWWYDYTQDGFPRGSEPQLGAVLCFTSRSQQPGHPYGWPGHVCVVEEIIDADTIRTSDSNYNGEYFETPIRRRADGWNRTGGSLDYVGCIYLYDEPTPPEPWTPSGEELIALLAIMKKRRRGEGF